MDFSVLLAHPGTWVSVTAAYLLFVAVTRMRYRTRVRNAPQRGLPGWAFEHARRSGLA